MVALVGSQWLGLSQCQLSHGVFLVDRAKCIGMWLLERARRWYARTFLICCAYMLYGFAVYIYWPLLRNSSNVCLDSDYAHTIHNARVEPTRKRDVQIKCDCVSIYTSKSAIWHTGSHSIGVRLFSQWMIDVVFFYFKQTRYLHLYGCNVSGNVYICSNLHILMWCMRIR